MEELRQQEANRLASMPPPGPSYKQRKEEREHEAAERLLAMGADEQWGASPRPLVKMPKNMARLSQKEAETLAARHFQVQPVHCLHVRIGFAQSA